jgi:hypothetical protein
MTEKGSDAQLAEVGSLARAALPAEAEEAAIEAEEERVVQAEAEDDPGESYPDPDEPPPADEVHGEYDPLPPE